MDAYAIAREAAERGELVLILVEPGRLRLRRYPRWRSRSSVILGCAKERAAFHASLAFYS